MRERDVDDLRAGILQPVDTLLPELLDFGWHAIDTVLLGNTNLAPLDGAANRGLVIRDRHVDAGRVLGIVAGHRAKHDRAVTHRARNRPRLIEGRCEGDHAPSRTAAIGGLDPNCSGEGGRLADRTAGVGRRGAEAQMRRHCRSGTARGPTGHEQPLLVSARSGFRPGAVPAWRQPWGNNRTIIRGLVRRAHGELIHVELAKHHGPVSPELGRHRGIIHRLEAIEHMAAGLCVHTLGRIQILDAQRDAFKRTGRASGKFRIRGLCHVERLVGGLGDIGIQRPRLFHGTEMRPGQVGRGNRALVQCIACFSQRQMGQIGHLGLSTSGHVSLGGKGKGREDECLTRRLWVP